MKRAGDAELLQNKSLQKFASVHANVPNRFNLERHLIDRKTYKTRRSAELSEWQSLRAGGQPGKGIVCQSDTSWDWTDSTFTRNLEKRGIFEKRNLDGEILQRLEDGNDTMTDRDAFFPLLRTRAHGAKR